MRVGIIGAGMAGLAAATCLAKHGVSDVVVIDKGRSVGGRMATRRIDVGSGVRADSGAQFVSAHTERFEREVVLPWTDRGVLKSWFGDARPRYCAIDGMNGWAKKIAGSLPANVEIMLESFVEKLTPRFDEQSNSVSSWEISYLDRLNERQLLHVDILVLTMPVPQTLHLLQPLASRVEQPTWERLRGVHYAPCITLLCQPEKALRLPPPEILRGKLPAPIGWLADNQQKGISSKSLLTIQMNGEWSEAHYDKPDEWVVEQILPLLSEFLSEVKMTQVKRWRYALASRLYPAAYVQMMGERAPIFACGDGFGTDGEEGRIETAWQSGTSCAERVLETLG